ncbi:helix-turn-helix transcriptional regulator [Amycolatopsis sp. NPDC026612]|uniref:helix-turn-helix domain-containing protein n=1 Tax=Amycolatopsis sp. NPDC026612 TaxID=3155466 RepID=UPI00340F915E
MEEDDMAGDLLRLLGIDPDAPEVGAAREDDANLANFMRCLYQLRKDNNISQAEVAKSMGTTQSAVSDLERTSTDPHVTTLQRYARAVGASLRLMAVAAPSNQGWEETAHVRARSTTSPVTVHQARSDNRRLRVIKWDQGSETRSA